MPTTTVLDTTIHHEETGTGTPFVFLHGSPASSHIWRNVLPRIDVPARLLAPDLVGMGRSGKPATGYRFTDHARYLDAWFDALGLDDVVLVGHDWGGTLAFDHAARHPGRVRGIAFLESIVKPLTWSELSEPSRRRFETLRTPGVGEKAALADNSAVEQAFTRGVRTPLTPEDLAPYLAPYLTPESRRPLLEWPRALPVDGEPADVHALVVAFDDWLKASDTVPKLLLTFDSSPTLLIDEKMAAWCAENIANLETVACGPAGHHAQEDRPEAIAAEITAWVGRHRLGPARGTGAA